MCLLLLVWLSCCLVFAFSSSNTSTGPQQVRVAVTTDPTSLIIQWTSPEICHNDSTVFYGLSHSSLTLHSLGECKIFEYGNPDGLHYIHTVKLNNLTRLTKYYYYVSSSNIKSQIFNVKTITDDPNYLPNILFLGDLGHKGGKIEHELFTALPQMTLEAQSGNIDMIIHAGDFAYNLDSDGGSRGDSFLRNIQNMSAYVPYMTIVGNHEWNYNASNYRNRFHMPRSQINDGFDMWYSLDYGPMHLLFFSTETLFNRPQDNENQFNWIKNDLINANNNRKERPWLITIGHRPMYCSNSDNDCLVPNSAGEQVRSYLEDLFFDMGVDIELWAHEHSYERCWPVYNYTVTQYNYINPKAPVHLISGAAGCNEDNGLCENPIIKSGGDWSAYRTMGYFHPYSYGHIKVLNNSVLYWDQINAKLDRIYDYIHIIQSNHGPFKSIV